MLLLQRKLKLERTKHPTGPHAARGPRLDIAALNLKPNLFEKYIKSTTIKGVTSTVQTKPKEMVRAEPTSNSTAGIDNNHSTMLTLLLELNVVCEQRWIQFELQNSPSRVLHLMTKFTPSFSKPVKLDHN